MAHTPREVIEENLNVALEKVQVGEKYYHYKSPDKLYTVTGIGIIEATEEPAVLYKPEYEETSIIWIRPLKEFLSEIETDSGKTTRFTRAS